jgi:hypothetical protein
VLREAEAGASLERVGGFGHKDGKRRIMRVDRAEKAGKGCVFWAFWTILA